MPGTGREWIRTLRPQHTKKREATSLLTSPLLGGGYLLSHFRSTIGVVRLNFSVRDGKRWDPHAMTTLFLYLPASTAHQVCRGCDILKKKPSGERSAGKILRLLESETSTGKNRSRPENACLVSSRLRAQESFRVISTARLRTLPPVHLPPIYVVVCNDPNGDLILRLASCLDAFSTYPYPTRLPGRAPGGTTGWPEVGPTRSSRTSVRSPQISYAHNR